MRFFEACSVLLTFALLVATWGLAWRKQRGLGRCVTIQACRPTTNFSTNKRMDVCLTRVSGQAEA